jgi:signal peptidase I
MNHTNKNNKDHKLKYYLKYIILDILIAALVSVLLITYVASAYKIEGNSMQIVLNDQERVIISKLGITNGGLKRFDIVVLYKPDNPKKSIIKRIIGLPEEIIEIRDGIVYINNQKQDEFYLENEKDLMFTSINMKPLLIQKGYYFVMGDNRPVSQDSRSFGPVPERYIFGKALFRYWPFSRFGKVE